jgi:hypothetical protein
LNSLSALHPTKNMTTIATQAAQHSMMSFFIVFSLCPFFVHRKERGRNLSHVSREALEKPCTIHERECTQSGAFASSSARASNFPSFSWTNQSVERQDFWHELYHTPFGVAKTCQISCVIFVKNRSFPVLYLVTCPRRLKSDMSNGQKTLTDRKQDGVVVLREWSDEVPHR